jgi:acyl-coenzyme A synthetase/AMP-(fatty) acid ligase/pimeloyl-ACP methyl ester carboxylesterase
VSPEGPGNLPGLDPRWSRTLRVPDAAGHPHTWHVLDNDVAPTSGTLLCVHGNPTWSYLWRRFLADARPGWRVVAVDQLGMGWSERLGRPRQLAERIADLEDLTRALGITGPVVVAAHDWGGPVVLGWALGHRDQLAGLVLTNTGVALPSGRSAPGVIRLARAAPLRTTVCVTTPAFVRGTLALARPPLPADVRAALAEPYATAARRRAVGDFVADIPLEDGHPSRPALDAVAAGMATLPDVPALLLWGPRDPVFGEPYLRDLIQRLPQADVHRYARAGHLVTEDAPETAEHAWRWIADRIEGPPGSRARPVDSGPPSIALGSALTARTGDPALAVAELERGQTRTTSFAELEQRVRALAVGLVDAGVRPGDRVALLVPPGLDLTTAVYACWRAGAVIVVADAGLGLAGLRTALRSASPDHIVGIGRGLAAVAALGLPGQRILAGPIFGRAARLVGAAHTLAQLVTRGQGRDHLPGPAQGGEAAVLFTSGATGPAKGVVYRADQLRAQIDAVRAVCGITADDRLVAAFAPFALYGPALGIAAAVPDMVLTRPGTLTAAALADAVTAIEATVVFASPAALRNVAATAGQLTDHQRQALRGVRRVMSAGAPVGAALLRKVQALVPAAELHTPYGMTEALPVADISLAQITAAGAGNGVCVGWPLPGVSVLISALDASGHATGPLVDAPEITGEISVAAPHVKERYDRLWATEQQSARDLGRHRTGDVGHLDAEGRLWVEGRLVHVVSTADGPVTPVGVEQRLEALAAVDTAAVVGVGPVGTQQVVAVLVPAEPVRGVLATPELAAAVRAAAGVPITAVLLVKALPVDIRHASKIDRARLARWADRVLAGGRVGRP